VLTKLARLGMGLAAIVLAGTGIALAATSDTPATTTKVSQAAASPTPSPNPFTWRGYVRAYDFTRQNAYSGPNSKPNQSTENNAISLHGDYAFADSGFDIGASYLYANPLNNCSTASSHFPQSPTTAPQSAINANPCAGTGFNGANGNANIYQDDTLPGFEMSTLYEAYLQYKGNGFFFKGGNLVGNQTWAPASDSRLKPSAFTGVDASYTFQKSWTVEAGDYWQWECRTCSAFDKYTLLTDPASPYPGATALSSFYYNPAQNGITNSGVFFARAGYAGPKSLPLTANLSYYQFNNISDAVWLDANYNLTGKAKGFVALQAGSEGNTGNSIVGKISSGVFGLKAGLNIFPNVQLWGAFDTIPIKTDTLSAATMASGGSKCNAVGQLALAAGQSKYKVNFPYFLPTGGTGECSVNADGSTNIYYGGWASPYTDSYATDPLFTTELTQGMVDRRSPGTSYKLQLTFTSDDRRFVAYVNEGWFDYNNGAYANGTTETDFDALYYFTPLPKKGLYHGFSFRYRYGNRVQNPTFTGGTPVGLFVYNRFQAEYDF
jgi:hypothetical protein